VGYLESKGTDLSKKSNKPLDKAFLDEMKRKFPDGNN